jgi:ribosomal protein S18 acetylase RimI-like enzyme
MVQLMPVTQEGDELDIVRQLFREYLAELDEDLCFQSFDAELHNPLKKYGEPEGVLLLARWNGEAAGCIALTPLKEPGVCEMKRLYVRPACRKHGIGRVLVEALLKQAVQKRYTCMKLDTLQKLQSAIRLYEQYGFVHTAPYYVNPIDGVVYMEKMLESAGG